jgi:opacity protein-like surface antigen
MNNLKFLLLWLVLAAPVVAQSPTPHFEVFGGVTWLRGETSPDLSSFGLSTINGLGWNASATENLNSWFGGTLDFSGAYARPTVTIQPNTFGEGLPATKIVFTDGINATAYTFMFGPTFAYRRSARFVPFARVLLGAANGRVATTSKGAAAIGMSESFSETHFALAAGGGVDIPISPRVAVRATADWIHTTFPNLVTDRQENFRVSGGVVLRF